MIDAKRFCPSCGREAAPNHLFCSACGTEIPSSQPESRTCPRCSAQLDDVAPFCWKCGQAVAATPRGYARALNARDRELEETLGMGIRRSPNGRFWPVLALVFLATTIALVILVASTWYSGGLPVLGSRVHTVTLAGFNTTLVLNGSVAAFGDVAFRNGVVSGDAGSTVLAVVLYQNAYVAGSLTYLSATSGGGFAIESTSPAMPFSIAPGGTQLVTYHVQLTSEAGVYFAPLTVLASH